MADAKAEPRTNEATHYSLCWFTQEPQREADGTVWWEQPVTDEYGRFGFSSLADAVAYAGSTLLAPVAEQPMQDWIGVIGHNGDPDDESVANHDDFSGWSEGWVTLDGAQPVFHAGDYEGDRGEIDRRPSAEEMLTLVEAAWHSETNGEIDTDEDEVLADLIVSLYRSAVEYVDLTAAQQLDRNGEEIDAVSNEQLAERVARALQIIWFGA